MSSVTLNSEKLKKLIDSHFFDDLQDRSYRVETIEAYKLLTHNRFDLSFKLLFLKMIDKDDNFSKEIYIEHIKALSLGEFNEPGDSNKNSIEDYLKAFENIFYDIKRNGFNNNKSVIPLSKNGYIANGSHRVASSIILDKEIDCVNIDADDHIYDYKFFYKRGVSQTIMDAAACEFIESSKNVFIAIIWPSAVGKDAQINQIIKNIVYEKQVKLNSNGAHNFLSQIYYGEEWVGSVEDDFKGSNGKLIECFKTFDPIRFIAFQSNSIDDVREIKEKIRNIFNIGKHSIHITDNQIEALRVSRILLNENSVHFLNYAKPNKFLSTHEKIKNFKLFLIQNNIKNEDVVLDSSIILSAYGLREARDTDFFCSNNQNIKYKLDLINTHDETLIHHGVEKIDIIYNLLYYFYFNDIKFVSFLNLYQMKLKRNESKDQIDSKLMVALIEDSFFKEHYAKLIQIIYYEKIKFRSRIMKLLKILGLYNFLKNIYRFFIIKK